jgi:hypothetical protein
LGKLVSIKFQSQISRVEQLARAKVRECLEEFSKSGSFSAADALRRAAFPKSEYVGSHERADGVWLAEIRYDHLLHEGVGTSQAAALVNAVLHMCDATDDAC